MKNPPTLSDETSIKENTRYVKIDEGSKQEDFKKIGERVQQGELKFSHYSIDGYKGIYHYLKIKN